MQYKYTVVDITEPVLDLKSEDLELASPYLINSKFRPLEHTVELEVKTLDGSILLVEDNSTSYRVHGGLEEASSNIDLDPESDVKRLGFELGDVIVNYKFFKEFFSTSKTGGEFFISEISESRTEIRAEAHSFTLDSYVNTVEELQERFRTSPNLPNITLKFGELSIICTNIQNLESEGNGEVLFKLYSPLPDSIKVKSKFRVREEVCYPHTFQVTVEFIPEEATYSSLKEPNFNLEILEGKSNSTPFLNYEQLFGYSVENTNYELYSKINTDGIELGIDYSEFQNFIHFSSAEERLINFKYKLDLITQNQTLKSAEPLGSVNKRQYYDQVIENIISNFDHYDRHLYYGIGDSSWPKDSNVKPYTPKASTDSEAVSWFQNKKVEAEEYDERNPDRLINSVPIFIREDENNEAYLLFVDMIGQHFDNIWIYTKSVSERYNADNRLDRGIPKDLVRAAVEGLGISIKDSSRNLENLFSMYIGEESSTGEEITTLEKITSDFEGLQPLAQKEYQQEIYKRIYHNVPFLLKTKGTERGLRALISCFGIPETILKVRVRGGADRTGQLISPSQPLDQNEDKIRLDNSGTILGTTLSSLTSINLPARKYTDDSHVVEIGFNLSNTVDEIIKDKVADTFNIDSYIGDPRKVYEPSYDSLMKLEKEVFATVGATDPVVISPRAFTRLVKFFDASLFRTIKDFVPARALVDSGIIIQSNLLHRNKAKQVQIGVESTSYSGSIEIGEQSGGDGGVYPLNLVTFKQGIGFTPSYSVDYLEQVKTPLGLVNKSITGGEARYTGELQGSEVTVTTGEVGSRNPFLGVGPKTTFTVNGKLVDPSETVDNTTCSVDLTATLLGSLLSFEITGNGKISIPSKSTMITGSVEDYIHDFRTGDLGLVAIPTAPYVFENWSVSGSAPYEPVTPLESLTVTDDFLDTKYKYKASFILPPSTPEANISLAINSTRDGVTITVTEHPTEALTVTVGYVEYNLVDRYVNLIVPSGGSTYQYTWNIGGVNEINSAGISAINGDITPPTEAGGYIWEWTQWDPRLGDQLPSE